MSADSEAAAELESWSHQGDTTLDLSGLDASGADLTGAHKRLRHRQGSKEYFLDIMREMKQRGLNGNTNEKRLYKELSKALKRGNVEYILVKGKVTSTGRYAGYQKWAFDIR